MLIRAPSHESWIAPERTRSRINSVNPLSNFQEDAAVVEPKDDVSQSSSIPPSEESLDAKMVRLGRERPPAFNSIWRELAFVFSINMSQILTEYFVSGFTLLLPTLIEELNIPQASSVWPATAFSLVIASTLIVFGRLGDMWGGYPVYLWGLSWLLLWSVIAGFSINPLMLVFCRALQGLGAAAFVPTGIMLLGSVYRPGPRKNFVFAIYGTSAVLGFFLGIFVAGVVAQYLLWGWFFWIGAILAALTIVASIFSIDNDRKERLEYDISMDWYGAATFVSGVVLVVFAITESAHAEQGWRTPYIPALFCLGVILVLLTVYIEGWVAKEPLLPADVFTVRGMTPLLLAICLLYGTMGNFLLYGTQYFQNIMGATPLQVVAWFTPMAVGGLLLSLMEGMVMHLVSGRLLLIISGIGCVLSQLLIALIPNGGNYWAWIFPAAICATIGIDLSYTLMTVFVTTQLPKARQGLAGGLINSGLQLGIALVLGFSDIIQSYTKDGEGGLRQSYKNTFYFGTAVGVVSLILMAVWGKIPKATSDLTADEKAELQREASRS